MRKYRKLKTIVFFAIFSAVLLFGRMEARAEGERVHFGSEWYQWNLDEPWQIGVYAESEDNMYSADMYVLYDAEMLEYYSGGELVEPGRVRVYASEIGRNEYMQMLQFIPRIAGNTQITIQQTPIVNENGETADAEAVSVNVNIPMADGCALSGILVNGTYVDGFTPENTGYFMDVEADTARAQVTVEPADIQAEIIGTSLSAGLNEIKITTTNALGARARYVLYVNRPETVVEEQPSKPVVLVEKEEKDGIPFETILISVAVVLAFLLVLMIVLCIRRWAIKRKRRRLRRERMQAARKKRAQEERRQDIQQPEHQKSDREDTAGNGVNEGKAEPQTADVKISGDMTEISDKEEKPLEIAVRNVTMEFKREKDEATSIKELMIRTLKGQRSYEMFKALDNVSFDIRQGEVVGIIGTNGSGKSTILKIISGALAPTEGYVDVDKKKIQLLTLGTGFDYELTGKENVYLNGAIIGYTKEYIDEKYDDIVKFAELEGFMEEKVRNYSSGMVSRLGFAIATVRDTPEILILDEVLSVGDMFFRKKSEARIKEMMHGGSTVLIVSHSTSVIRNNCTKAVWIEKGVMRAIGDPKEVCAAYEKMNEAG